MTDDITWIKHQAKWAAKWALLGNLLPKVIQPAFTIILARILIPDDFGIIGIATIVIGFAKMVESMGLRQALIQSNEDIDKVANVVFWSNLFLCCLLYVIIFMLSPQLANFFNEPRSNLVIRVMGLQLVISALDDVQEAILQRDFRFNKWSAFKVMYTLVPGLISIPLALAGFGYWSLVIGTLAGTTIGVIYLWRVSKWRPQLKFDIRIARLLWRFGTLVMVESLQGWALNYGDNLAVGHFMNTDDLGRYAFGFNLVNLITGFGVTPFSEVAYSAFCRLSSQTEELQRSFIQLTRLLALIVIPICVGLSLLSAPLVNIILGRKWSGLEPIIAILAIMPGLSHIISFNPLLYKAINRPDIMPKFHLAQLLYIIPAYIVGSQYGLKIFCLFRASVGIIFFIPHIWISIKILKLPYNYFWSCVRSSFYSVLIMGFTVFSLIKLLEPFNGCISWIKLIAIISGGVSSYIISLWLIDQPQFLRTVQFIRGVI